MTVQELLNILENIENKEQDVAVRYEPLLKDEEPVFSKFDVQTVSIGIERGGTEKYVYIDV